MPLAPFLLPPRFEAAARVARWRSVALCLGASSDRARRAVAARWRSTGPTFDGGRALAPLDPSLRALCDLRHPHLWYTQARRMRRTVHLHVGPTNSGKTHAAMQALKAAPSGVYCGPLRLLAWEIFERLNAEGTPCTLRTGQEVEEVEGARVTSSTVEMVDVDTRVDCAVLDEIQMISDPNRGWAWSRVLLGCAAPSLHCCGDPAAVPLVAALLRLTGDELVVHQYTRLSPLEVAKRPVPSLSAVQRGDCLVAFSRRELFAVKRDVEAATGLRCGLIYGALPPQVRREQALRFNLHSSGQPPSGGGAPALEPLDVLVATDAVGMGLNLAISRVLFTRLDKFDGTSRRPLTISETKQIGGRAGRFGSACPAGVVSALQRQHLPRLSIALAAATPPLRSAGVLPQLAQLEEFAAALLQMPEDDRELRSRPVPPAAAAGDERQPRQRGVHQPAPPRSTDTLTAAAGWAGVFDARGNYLEVRGRAKEGEGVLTRISGARDAHMVGDGEGGGDNACGADPADDDQDVEALLSAMSGIEAYRLQTGAPRIGAAVSVSDDFAASCNSDDNDGDADDDDDGELDAALFDGRLRSGASRRTRSRANAVLASGVTFTAILEGFVRYARVNGGLYHLCDTRELLDVSRALDTVPGLPFRVRYAWCLAPVDVSDPLLATALKRYARKFAELGRVRVGLRVPSTPPRSPAELAELESAHAVYDLYLWLGRRYPGEFVQLEEALAAAATTQALIQQGLQTLGDVALARSGAARRRRALAALTSNVTVTSPEGEAHAEAEADAGGSAYLQAMVVVDDDDGDNENEGTVGAWRGGDSARTRARSASRKAALREARRTGRQAERRATGLLVEAFETGGLASVRELQRAPAWRDATDGRKREQPPRERPGREGQPHAGGARHANDALLAGLPPPRLRDGGAQF